MLSDKISKLNAEHELVRDFGAFIVGVDKIGGGTLGREYSGDWTATLYSLSGNLLEEIPVRTGMLHTHKFVATLVNEDFMGE